ncbi:MAG: catechol 1,2-dioxygenase, partial [Actinobacteria bacterium]|nr:catechol 1,2-dioxygenase [Actinomycetota bacterium]
GAMGEADFVAPGVQYSDYENAIGTSQVHVWFDRPATGWTRASTGEQRVSA